MNKTFIKKILYAIVFVIILFSVCVTSTSYAHTNINSVYLQKVGQADYHLKYNFGDRTTYIICSVVGHYIDDVFYPAYCLNTERTGAEKEPYNVSINNVLKNDAVWRVLINGYPYQTAESMGLSDFDAFCVTKMAVYCVLGESDINNYVADPSDEIAVHMLNKLKQLVDIGLYGTDTMKIGTLSSNKIGELTEVENYYYQEYSINSGVQISNYTINNITGFGSGSFIANTNGVAQNIFQSGEHFRIYIPKSNLNSNINGQIYINSKSKIFPILYGESNNPNLQDYAITSDSYGDESIIVNMNIETNTGKIILKKTDDFTKETIEGAIFGLYKTDGTEVAKLTTDINGVAMFTNLYQNNYILREISANDKYNLNTEEFMVNVIFNGITTINVENEYKKGNLKICKIDKDSKIGIEGVEFELYSEEFQKIIGIYKTNKNGEIYVENLRVRKLYS